jgi:WbqC-like protein family
MIVAIHQPNYIPWLGYFAKIFDSDVFVLLDDVQYSKKSVGAKNYILSKDEKKIPLSVSVKMSNGAFQNYNQLQIDYSTNWHIKHINKIKDAYCKAKFFNQYFEQFNNILKKKHQHLSELNIELILWLLTLLECETQIEISSKLHLPSIEDKNQRNIQICKHFGANTYLSGQGAKKYNVEQDFIEANIKLKYQQFTHPSYSQKSKVFVENLSAIDALFNVGADELNSLLKG